MDQLAAMRSFVKTVDAGGFSEAARQMNLAVSSVTRQINSLEKLLNTQLLYRSTRSVTLTPLGQKYYNRAVKILQDVEEARLCITEQTDIPHGLLRVGLPVVFGQLHIAPLLAEFLSRYPDIQLDLQLSDRLSNLVEEELDLVIRVGNLERSSSNLVLRKLASYTRLVCGSPNYFEQHGKPKLPNDLAQHNCLLFAYAAGYSIWQFQQAGKTYDVRVRGAICANNSALLRQACIDGTGIILMPTWLTGEDIRSGRLQTVLTDFQVQPQAEVDSGIYALYLPNRRHSLRVKVFIDFLKEQLMHF
ncbi:MAG: LysR family transcriptional regulator [Leptolyngbya foveolarum]|uniref:LysR family transcriptional regulator n=1 Tax=Leptolyngbya foveolarum TaxID=47253 RepID=A0A2W4VMU6_9CYAN|nr:MAG: LysR family transcriptional regulator [Leptolyngbya foveolarum]